jgi:hypothetical protein
LNHKDSSWIGASAFSTIVFIIIISLGILFTSLIFIIRNMQLTVISADQPPEGLLYASSLSADLLPAVFIGLSMPEIPAMMHCSMIYKRELRDLILPMALPSQCSFPVSLIG